MSELHISLHVEPESDTSLHVDEVDDMGMTLAERFDAAGTPYEGAYEVTPSSSAQVLPTAFHKLLGDITINPIPSNYGLITWNGSTITVS